MSDKRGSWLGRLLGQKKAPQSDEKPQQTQDSAGTKPQEEREKDKRDREVNRQSPVKAAPRTPSPSVSGEWKPGKVAADIYEVVREIGHGGMGVVYLLKERGSDRPAAAKVPLGEFIQHPQARQRFTREAQTWTELAAHPNIVRAYDVREVDYLPCIFMEYLEGGSLAKRLEASPGGLPFEEAFSAAIQTCWAMAFAHEKGQVHRDLKPANLLRTADGVVKVTDFGLVRPVTLEEAPVKQALAEAGMAFDAGLAASMTQGIAVGTYPYMAPEQWEGEATPAVDIYAFGVVLCELFCGQRPLDLRTHPKHRGKEVHPDARGYFYKQLHQEEKPLDPATLRPGLPEAVRKLILRCLEKQPEHRPASFNHIADELTTIYSKVLGKSFPMKKPGKVELDRQQKKDRAWALIRLGFGCKFRGDAKEAISLCQESLNIFKELGDLAGMAVCYNNIGVILKERGDFNGALKQYQQSLTIREQLGDRAGMAECYNNIGVILANRGDHEGALKQYRQSLSISEELGDLAGTARCYINIGVVFMDRGDYDGALKQYQQSLAIKDELGDRAGMAGCYNNIGNILCSRGAYDDALKQHQQSLAIREQLGNRAGIAECYNNIGNILGNRGDYDGAIKHYQQSLEIEKELGDRARMATCYNNIGVILNKRGDYENALKQFQQSLVIKEELGDRAGMARCYLNIGNILKDRGDYDGALEKYGQSLKIHEELGDRAEIARCYANMGLTYELLGNKTKALQMFREMLAISKQLGMPVPEWLPRRD